MGFSLQCRVICAPNKTVPGNREKDFQTAGSYSFCDKQLNILNFDKTLNILKHTMLDALKRLCNGITLRPAILADSFKNG